MHLESLNWMHVEQHLSTDDRLVFVVGACEQHGYLSLLTDVKVPLAMAEAASERTGVLVAPALPFGVSPWFTTYPGTISLRVSTFLAVIDDLVRSAYDHGFRRLLFVNGHGGNQPATARLGELANELPGLRTAWYSWWTAPSVTAVAEAAGLRSFHAGWIEAFRFCRVADLPTGAKEPVVTRRMLGAREVREAYGDGVFGGPYEVSDEIMDRVFEAAVGDIVELLGAM